MNTDFLIHYGILGMKWGIRRQRGSDGTVGGTAKKSKVSEDHTTTRSLMTKKKTSQLTNQELRTINERLNLEKQYKDLNRQQISKGRKFVGDILSTSGKTAATTIATAAALYGAKKAVNKLWGAEVTEALFPKKKK